MPFNSIYATFLVYFRLKELHTIYNIFVYISFIYNLFRNLKLVIFQIYFVHVCINVLVIG